MTTETTYLRYCIIVHSHNGNLLTIEDTKKILGTPNMSDEDATEIRDGFRRLIEVIYDKSMEERRKSVQEKKAKARENLLKTKQKV